MLPHGHRTHSCKPMLRYTAAVPPAPATDLKAKAPKAPKAQAPTASAPADGPALFAKALLKAGLQYDLHA